MTFAFQIALAAVLSVAMVAVAHPVRQHLDGVCSGGRTKQKATENTCGSLRERSGFAVVPARSPRVGNDGKQCPNGQYCNSGASCCNSGAFCCQNSTCCQDTCCQNTGVHAETCCPDPTNGGVCCLEEVTFCCKPNSAFDLPSRCCPRWYICCDAGRYGCCDPTTMLPMEANQGLALIETTNLLDNTRLKGYSIDLASGTYTSAALQKGVFYIDQENTRKFMFNPKNGKFYLLQANFLPPGEKPKPRADDPQRAIHLYEIDPVSGTVVKRAVTGADDEVTGYHFVAETQTIVAATWWYDGSAHVGYKFYHVDPDTGMAKKVSELRNPSSGDTYAGWFHEVSPDMTTVFRLGYKHVVRGTDFGVGIVNISAPVAVFQSWVAVPDPVLHGHFRSLHFFGAKPALHGDAGTTDVEFLSLAPSDNITDTGDLSLFAWTLKHPGQSKKVATFKNAHLTPYFGPIAESLNKGRTKYAATVTAASALGRQYGAWTVGVVDLTTGNMTQVELQPLMLDSTTSVSGFGIPFTSGVWHH